MTSTDRTLWRRLVFDHVRKEVTDQFLGTAQPYIGLWFGDGREPPAVSMENVVSLPTLGAMSIILSLNGMRVLYPMMLMLGELRLGVCVPRIALNKQPTLREALARCYGGKPCSRIASAAIDSVIFDWIFRDEWIVRVDFMSAAVADQARLSLLADAVAKSAQHLIVSSCAILTGSVSASKQPS